ncbi:MAG: ascorbate system or component [Oceanotoga sp.]|uniref:PTS sugar transporter subunit IIA n=1 Tax=Oceanotoga sp. TaxID=2108366 RepID=UPI0026501BB5|nr:PTS sugar transporter subunit IIA [Oceanotoga sp.]MDN5342990.1 ascorbate system or component [Oceanotoga sp.]
MKELIKKENIKVNVDVSNWEDAIRVSGELLVKSKSISKKYVENMIDSVKNLGPYIVIAPGIAIAHSKPDNKIVYKSDISLITLKKPVEFGNKKNDPVKLVFSFASKESEGHLQNLSKIADLLEKEGFVEEISESSDENEIYNLLNKI